MKSTIAITLLITATSSAFMHEARSDISHQRSINSGSKANPKNSDTALHLYRSAAEAIAEAEQICAMEGPDSHNCKVAWDIVEELEAADAHVRTPDTGAHELSYSPMVNGLEILSVKIEKKMDELKKLSTQLAEAGAGPEVERLVYASDEMKQIIAEARSAMDQYR